MANSFLLELDTKGPVLTIDAPTSSIPGNIITIIINSEEELDSYQNIYTIDYSNIIRTQTFQKKDDYTLIGNLDLTGYSYGTAKLHITLRDIVYNISSKIIPIMIENVKNVYLDLDWETRNEIIEIESRNMEIDINSRDTHIEFE